MKGKTTKKERRGRQNRNKKRLEMEEQSMGFDLEQSRLIVVPNDNYAGKRKMNFGRRGSGSFLPPQNSMQ